jgi:hypothetical protein
VDDGQQEGQSVWQRHAAAGLHAPRQREQQVQCHEHGEQQAQLQAEKQMSLAGKPVDEIECAQL